MQTPSCCLRSNAAAVEPKSKQEEDQADTWAPQLAPAAPPRPQQPQGARQGLWRRKEARGEAQPAAPAAAARGAWIRTLFGGRTAAGEGRGDGAAHAAESKVMPPSDPAAEEPQEEPAVPATLGATASPGVAESSKEAEAGSTDEAQQEGEAAEARLDAREDAEPLSVAASVDNVELAVAGSPAAGSLPASAEEGAATAVHETAEPGAEDVGGGGDGDEVDEV